LKEVLRKGIPAKAVDTPGQRLRIQGTQALPRVGTFPKFCIEAFFRVIKAGGKATLSRSAEAAAQALGAPNEPDYLGQPAKNRQKGGASSDQPGNAAEEGGAQQAKEEEPEQSKEQPTPGPRAEAKPQETAEGRRQRKG